MRLPAVLDRSINKLLCTAFGFHNNGGAQKLLRLVQRAAPGDESTERTVGISSDPEYGDAIAGLAAEIHGRPDLPVGMHTDRRS